MIVSQSWFVFISMGFLVITLCFMAAIGFMIYASVEMRKAALAFREFLDRSEKRLTPVLEEAEKTLKSVRNVSEDVAVTTGNIRDLSGVICDITINLRAISGLADDLREGVSLRGAGLRAGFRAALGILVKRINERRH